MTAKTRTVIRLYKAGRKTGADVLASMGENPTREDLLEAASLMMLRVPEDASDSEIAEAIGNA